MAKLNQKVASKTTPNVTNRAGGTAYSESNELQLAGILLSSFFSGGDSYYEGHNDRVERLRTTISSVDPSFAAKAAIYARDKFGMRTASHLVALQLAKESADKFPKYRFFKNVIIRPDDMLEIAAGILSEKDASLPNALKRAFSEILSGYSEYNLTKYRALGKTVNMYDLVNLVHPKATTALNAFMKGESKAPETYEVKLTQAGQNISEDLTEEEKNLQVAENKKNAWRDLITSRKLGYFALLRNLRNIATQADHDTIDAACKMLVDKKLLANSRVMPFRFLSAYDELRLCGNSKILTALSDALDLSLANIPDFTGRTLVAVDESGSMSSTNSRNKISNRRLACIFAGALTKKNASTDLMAFSDQASYVSFNLRTPLIDIERCFPNRPRGTDFNTIFNLATSSKKVYDRIIIISDMQGWMDISKPQVNTQTGYNIFRSSTYPMYATGGAPVSSFANYRKVTGSDPMVYSWDIAGYGDMMFKEDKVITLAGWMGDKVFELMEKVEGGLESVVDDIKRVEL